jgi:large subunit ribosomal protein L27Ae
MIFFPFSITAFQMVTRLRQTRHKRGQLTMGYGRVGKHRKHPAGRGLAGGQHHHRTWMDKYHPGYFGKVGMRHFHKTKNPSFTPSANVGDLWHLLGKETLAKAEAEAKKGSKQAAMIDLTERGIFKLLGKGELPKLPIVVKAREVSAIAERKIKAVGGAIILTA